MSTTNTTLTDTVESTETDVTSEDHDSTPNEVYQWLDDREYSKVGDGDSFAYLHRLLACVDHNPYEVYSPRKEVHHESGAKFDNRREALSVRTITEHRRLHDGGEWTDVDDEPRLERVESDVTQYASD